MRNLVMCIYISLLTAMVFLFASCSKHHSETLPVITPTVNRIPYSVIAYLITPKDKTISASYYIAEKSCLLSLQNWYRSQMNNKTFTLNPVVVDTLTGLHNASWYNSDNGLSAAGDTSRNGYYNTLYEMKQLLGANFNTTVYTYFVCVAADFPEETIPKGLSAEGLGILSGLAGSNPNFYTGYSGHSLGHAFGLPETATEDSSAIMSLGAPKYPNCILLQSEKDSLNSSPFFK